MSMLVPSHRSSLLPWAGFKDLEDRINRLFSEFPISLDAATGGAWAPAVDLEETADAYLLDADLPGMKKEDIELTVVNDVLTLKGTRKDERSENTEGFRRVERTYGEFQRSFRIPGGIDAAKVEAKFENGVLKIRLPKAEAVKPKQIEVKVN